ncbi:MAG: hypothetical protein M3044_21265 [Thermoproteota archaeon]|nr:hypothetical protein [Thermoproteota archaeon]
MISTNGERPIRTSSPSPIPTGPNSSRLVDEVRRRNNIISVLMSVHTVRVIGISFVIGVSLGILSPIFGYTAGIGDILIRVTALPMAYFFRRGHRLAANVSIVWNILGSIDLVAAIFLGITTSNPRLSAVVYHTSNTHPTMTTMPWVLIPAIGVPILLTIHIITLWMLRGTNIKRKL